MAMTMQELVERYVLLRGLGAKSGKQYEMLLDRLRAFLGRDATADDLDDLQLSRYLKWRAETPGWRGRLPAPATVKKDRTMLHAVCNYAARKKLVREFPELPPVKVPMSLPVGRAYTAEDVGKLIRRARHRIGHTGGVPSAWWWQTIIYAIYCTGERLEATMSLRWRDVDLERCRVVFRGQHRKGKTRDIERQITPELAAMLAMHRRNDDELVWPSDRRSRFMWNSMKLLCKLAGVKYRSFHGLRRTAASYAALAGGTAAATQLLDHSDPKLQERYVDPLICPTDSDSTRALPTLDLTEPPGGPGKPR
jgi:integrase